MWCFTWLFLFRGLESLLKFLDLSHRCQIYSPLHHAAERFLQKSLTWLLSAPCSGEIWLPLQNSAERFDSSLHDAAGSQTSLQINPRIWKKRIWIRVQGEYFKWNKRRWKISRYCPFKFLLEPEFACKCLSIRESGRERYYPYIIYKFVGFLGPVA